MSGKFLYFSMLVFCQDPSRVPPLGAVETAGCGNDAVVKCIILYNFIGNNFVASDADVGF